jgi:hypothetical protein
MLKGIDLTLMIGPVVPLPVSKDVLDALISVEVTSRTEKASGFQLKFILSKNSPLQTIFLVAGGAQIPLVRVLILVTLNGTTEVLMDGVMTNHEVTGGSAKEGPVLTITGEDLSRVMDYIDFTGLFQYPAMPPEARVFLILAKYAFLGVIPLVIPSVLIDVPIPVDRIPIHQGTDYCYLNKLADEAGYVFYVDPGPAPGTSIGYWGPPVKVGLSQPALNIDMDAHTNVESLSFSFNSQKATLSILVIQEQLTKLPIPIPVPEITPINPPLGLIPPLQLNVDKLDGTGKLSPVQAALRGLSIAAKKADAVSAQGSLDVLRYGQVLKTRRLVGVRGAGLAFDGLYFVDSVTHHLKRGTYTQDFTLVRNGLISTVSRVPA